MNSLLSKILIGAVVGLFLASSTLAFLYKKSRTDLKRQRSNVENLMQVHNQELVLTRRQYELSEAEWKEKIDSLLEENRIALKQVKTVTVVNAVFRDTTSREAVMGTPEPIAPIEAKLDSPEWKIPAVVSGSCWWMKGEITSKDPESQLTVLESGWNNSVQLLVVRHRFLGFLWWKKKQEFKAFSDCGEVDFTKIEFVK